MNFTNFRGSSESPFLQTLDSRQWKERLNQAGDGVMIMINIGSNDDHRHHHHDHDLLRENKRLEKMIQIIAHVLWMSHPFRPK